MYDDLIVQVLIFDQHGEHFDYDVNNLILDETEPTSLFSGEILKNISDFKNDRINSLLHQILQNKNLDTSLNQVQSIPKSVELEESVRQGIQNFSCTRDDFGLVTISGLYNNDDIKRTQVNLDISFLDNEGTSIGKTSATFNDLKEFESKRFLGHSKWSENFHSCQISIE